MAASYGRSDIWISEESHLSAKMVVLVCIPMDSMLGYFPAIPTSLAEFSIFQFLDHGHSHWGKVKSHCVFCLHFPDPEHLLMFLLAICT